MSKFVSLIFLVLVSVALFGQNDEAFLHNGKTEEVKILKVNEFNITYTYPNETAEQVVSRYLVDKIEYGSGRTEEISDKIEISGKEDWEKVIVLVDKAAIVGLIKKDEVRGKTSGLISFHTAGSADRKSMKKLKEAAAEMGCPFVYITADKDNLLTKQSVKKAYAYCYE